MDSILSPKAEDILHTATSCREPLYHTRWIMAHNAFHGVVHSGDSSSLREAWDAYLRELETAEQVATTPA